MLFLRLLLALLTLAGLVSAHAEACDVGGNRPGPPVAGDAQNRLVSLTQGGVNYRYAYDYRTRRVQQQEGIGDAGRQTGFSPREAKSLLSNQVLN